MSFFWVSLQGLRSCKGTPLHKDRGPFCSRLPSCLTDVVCSCSSSTGLHCFIRTCTFYFFMFIFRLHRPPHAVSSLNAPLCFFVFHPSQLMAQGNVHLYTFHTDSLFSAVLAARAGPAWGAPVLAGWGGGDSRCSWRMELSVCQPSPQGQQQWSGSCGDDWVQFLGYEIEAQMSGRFWSLYRFIRLVMVPVCASCDNPIYFSSSKLDVSLRATFPQDIWPGSTL